MLPLWGRRPLLRQWGRAIQQDCAGAPTQRGETMATVSTETLVTRIAALQDYKRYEDLHWEGSFEEYLHLVQERPEVTRNAFQRVYDMVVSYGEEEYIDSKKRLVRY